MEYIVAIWIIWIKSGSNLDNMWIKCGAIGGMKEDYVIQVEWCMCVPECVSVFQQWLVILHGGPPAPTPRLTDRPAV